MTRIPARRQCRASSASAWSPRSAPRSPAAAAAPARSNSTTAIPSRRTTRSTASTSPNIRGRSTGTRWRAAASNSSGSRRPRAATISTSASRPTGRAAKQAGIPHGAYHFVYWCRPAIEEATWFEQNVPVEDDALPPVLDVEPTPNSRTCRRHLERNATIADMKVMLDEMERHFGKRPIIYTSLDFYHAILADGAFADYPIWVRSTKHHPAVPYGSRPWKFWQYQADGVDSRHRRARRPQRLLRHAASNGRRSSTVRSARARRGPPIPPTAPAPRPSLSCSRPTVPRRRRPCESARETDAN